jgi:hypothetical protein
MLMADSVRCLLILIFCGFTGVAQTTPSPPFELPGEPPVSLLQTDTARVNASTMGLRISSDFDDNALNSAQNHEAGLAVFVQPHLGWRLAGARFDWSVDCTLGFSRGQNSSAYDSLSHVLDGGFKAKLTKRLRLLAHEAFLNSTNPFDQLQASESPTSPTAGTVPAVTATVTSAGVQTEAASADIGYVLSAHSTVGAGGEFFGARYSLPTGALLSNQLLQNSSSAIGRSYYMRQITRRQWAGLDYRVQKSIFNSGQSTSFVHGLAYTHAVALSPAMTLSAFLGAERSVTQTVTGVFSSASTIFSGPLPAWHWSGGLTGRWRGKRAAISARLSRRINNGGILGTADLSSASADINRPFARQWTARLLASYDHGKALAGPDTLASASVAAGLSRNVTSNLWLEFQYWRIQMYSETLPASLLADHNRISMSLVYEHRHPLGQ